MWGAIAHARDDTWPVQRSEPMKTEKNCAVCSGVFFATRHDGVYCGKKCRKSSKLHKKQCKNCKRDFHSSKKSSVFCSKECTGLARTLDGRKCSKCGNGCDRSAKTCAKCYIPIYYNPPKTENTAKHSAKHFRAVEGLFRDPRGVVHYARNLTKFVSENKHLFLPEDTIDTSKDSTPRVRAAHGLGILYRGTRGSWKGWTLVSDVEIKEHGWDLLRRKVLPSATQSAIVPPS